MNIYKIFFSFFFLNRFVPHSFIFLRALYFAYATYIVFVILIVNIQCDCVNNCIAPLTEKYSVFIYGNNCYLFNNVPVTMSRAQSSCPSGSLIRRSFTGPSYHVTGNPGDFIIEFHLRFPRINDIFDIRNGKRSL